jgi:nitroreductase
METSNNLNDIFREPAGAGFSRQEVPRVLIEEILDLARRAPSGVNTQPWNVFVLQGHALAGLVSSALASLPGLVATASGRAAFREQFDRHPGAAEWPGQGSQTTGDKYLSEAMAAADTDATHAALQTYFRFCDAPAGLMFTISRDLGFGSLLDYGMFLQNMVLAARARGLHTRVQAGWKGLSDLVLPRLGAPDDALLVCGMALGYADMSRASTALRVDAPPVASFTTWHN